MAVLVKGWHGSSGTRFSKCCQVEKRQQEREDVFFLLFCCHKLTLAKKFDGTVVLSKTKEKYYMGHGEKGKWRGFLNWKGLFILLLKGQRTD